MHKLSLGNYAAALNYGKVNGIIMPKRWHLPEPRVECAIRRKRVVSLRQIQVGQGQVNFVAVSNILKHGDGRQESILPVAVNDLLPQRRKHRVWASDPRLLSSVANNGHRCQHNSHTVSGSDKHTSAPRPWAVSHNLSFLSRVWSRQERDLKSHYKNRIIFLSFLNKI